MTVSALAKIQTEYFPNALSPEPTYSASPL
jgi:hypothetical protein